MRYVMQLLKVFLFLAVFHGIILGCSSIPDIRINYQLPMEKSQLKGKRVFLTVSDSRSDSEILAPRARKELPNFSGNLSLIVSRSNQTGFMVGIFRVKRILYEAFKRRLENKGAEVCSDPNCGLELEITLLNFLMDIVDRNWVITMAYEARLKHGEKAVAIRKIEGKAERLKLIGTGSLESVLSDIFTDLVNRLDLISLLRVTTAE